MLLGPGPPGHPQDPFLCPDLPRPNRKKPPPNPRNHQSSPQIISIKSPAIHAPRYTNDASARDRSVGATIIAAGLEHFGLEKRDLILMRKNDWWKAMMAMMISERISLSHEWITKQLDMGHKTSVSSLSSRMKNEISKDRKLQKTKADITRIFS